MELRTVNSEHLRSVGAEISHGDDASVVLSIVLVGQHGGVNVAQVHDVGCT